MQLGQHAGVVSLGPNDRPPTDDEVAAQLARFVQAVRDDLGEAVVIEKESIPDSSVEATSVAPQREGACTIYWLEVGSSELVLHVGDGGRWRLNRDLNAVKLIERIGRSVIDGRVQEVFALGRSEVSVISTTGV